MPVSPLRERAEEMGGSMEAAVEVKGGWRERRRMERGWRERRRRPGSRKFLEILGISRNVLDCWRRRYRADQVRVAFQGCALLLAIPEIGTTMGTYVAGPPYLRLDANRRGQLDWRDRPMTRPP